VHTGNLGKHRARRHCPGSWELREFDHGKETNFVLADAHGRLVCEASHRRPPRELKFARDCRACHEKDDTPVGKSARQCDRGHSTGSWKSAQVL
jgi:hypothetical protein